tara:strand:+ start:291 stop:470 length:180 start_codon:yes stop_codon:yes gene_type:complete
MNYREAKWMKEWSSVTKSRTIKLDWDLPNLNIIIRKNGQTKIVPLSILVDNYLFMEEQQ